MKNMNELVNRVKNEAVIIEGDFSQNKISNKQWINIYGL